MAVVAADRANGFYANDSAGHGSRQLSLIEIPKLQRGGAAAAMDTDRGSGGSRETREDRSEEGFSRGRNDRARLLLRLVCIVRVCVYVCGIVNANLYQS